MVFPRTFTQRMAALACSEGGLGGPLMSNGYLMKGTQGSMVLADVRETKAALTF